MESSAVTPIPAPQQARGGESADKNEAPLLAGFDGSWTAATPLGVRYGLLYAVGCPTTSICLAGGLSLVTTLVRA